MSTAVKNEYAVDHTDGLHTDLPSSFREFREKYLPKGSKDRFERMADEHAAHIKFLHEQYGEQIKEKEKTIANLRERVLKLENGDTFKAKEEQLKHQEQLNSDLRFQIQHQELTNRVEIEALTTKLNNCQSNFRELEKENNDLRNDLEKAQSALKHMAIDAKESRTAAMRKYVEAGEILRRALCSLADRDQDYKTSLPEALDAETGDWDKSLVKPVGTCPVCLEEKYYYDKFGLCSNQHGVCWVCIGKLPRVSVNVKDPVTGEDVKDPATGMIETKLVSKCPKCRIETETWAYCCLNLQEFNELYKENPIFFNSLKLDEKMVNLFGRFKELNAQAIVY